MTLLIAVMAAIVSTIVWYTYENRAQMQLGFLSLMFWGASIMWFVDAVFEYVELGAEEYFVPTGADMLNDMFLGLSVVAFGLIIWLVKLLINDPKGVVKKALVRKK